MSKKNKNKSAAASNKEPTPPVDTAPPEPRADPTEQPPADSAPADSAPPPVQPSGSRKPRKPKPTEYRCSARTWVRLRGIRWERAAGFLYEMRKKHNGDKTRDAWLVLWDKFHARPV